MVDAIRRDLAVVGGRVDGEDVGLGSGEAPLRVSNAKLDAGVVVNPPRLHMYSVHHVEDLIGDDFQGRQTSLPQCHFQIWIVRNLDVCCKFHTRIPGAG
jgi:hypothetical protein